MREHERFRSPHWVLDERYHHDHFYPSVGYCIGALPAGNVGVTFRGGRFFFHAGVWYQPGACGYVVARPPVGIIVPVLPPTYSTVWVAGAPYYYANEIYYAQAPGGLRGRHDAHGCHSGTWRSIIPSARRAGAGCSRNLVLLRFGEGLLPLRCHLQ